MKVNNYNAHNNKAWMIYLKMGKTLSTINKSTTLGLRLKQMNVEAAIIKIRHNNNMHHMCMLKSKGL